jgi:hypothetical protein
MDEALAKTAKGRLVIEFKQCGYLKCRCSRGLQDGPYFIKRWREGGRQRKQCVPWWEVVATFTALERERAMVPSKAELGWCPGKPGDSRHES